MPIDLQLLQSGDVILLQGTSLVSRGIRWFTDSKYSHVCLYVGGGSNYIIESTEAGVEKNELQKILAHASSVCVRRHTGLTVEESELIKTKAYSLIYENYDYIQLLSLGVYFSLRRLGITWGSIVASMPGRLICSELVAVAYLCIPLKFKSKTKLVTPQTLYETELLDTVLEEEIK